MGRKIILLSDGTGNSSAKVWRTNVWRVFESLDLKGSGQVAFYDDGVGTSSFKPMAMLGGAFGFGLKRNVIDIYKFACRNWRAPDDEIFGFGFSRGAFTMRVVIGLIVDQGLIRADSEAELSRAAVEAYRNYRRKKYHTFWRFPEIIARAMRDGLVWARDRLTGQHFTPPPVVHGVNIRFLGLWDTVAAYGMPVEEMTRGISQWLFPLSLPTCDLHKDVVRACHALSIDDERTTFHPTLWDETNEAPLKPRPDGTMHLADERISQVWFAGVHSNVGGGYPDDSLAHIPLAWIMTEAAAAGLSFKVHSHASPQSLPHAATVADKDGRIYDPRAGLGGYYRYGPRDIAALGKGLLARKGSGAGLPRIHASVLDRIKNNAHQYAPTALPAQYEVVLSSGEVLPPAKNTIEHSAQAAQRSWAQQKVWNTIWLRRIVYFLTVAATVYLLIFPLLKALPRDAEYTSPLRWISDIVRMVGAFLPGVADTWINGYARDPLQFAITAIVVGALIVWGGWLAGRLRNNMGTIWHRSMNGMLSGVKEPNDWIYNFRTSGPYRAFHGSLKRYVAPAAFAFIFAYIGFALLSHASYNMQDYAGWVCHTDKVPEGLKPGESRSLGTFKPDALCQNMNVLLEKNARYLLTIKGTKTFYDGDVPAWKGIYFLDPPGFFPKLAQFAGIPLRRELSRPWFRIVARFGSEGGEETFLDPDSDGSISEVIQVTRNGELYLFVNDAVLGYRGLYGYFYGNNKGTAEVTITRGKGCFVCADLTPP